MNKELQKNEDSISVPFGNVVRKDVNALAMVPTKEKISILARKVYNVMLHYAQDQGAERDIYRARLKDVVNGIEFNSNNTEIIKEHLRQMITTKVEWQSPTKGEGARWVASGLISHAELRTEKNEVLMEWSYAPNIKQSILDPQRYARISLTFQAQFKTISGLVLYEICSRYVDNPGGVTSRQHWTWWRPVLTGAPDDGLPSTYDEWKYFNRDIVKCAVAEVNQLTDLEIKPIEHKKGRSVVDLQFSVTRKKQINLPLSSVASPVNLKDIGRAIKAGVHQSRAEKLLEKHGEKTFGKGIDALEARLLQTHLGEVRAPDKYLAAALTTADDNIRVLKDVPPLATVKTETKSVRLALIEQYRDDKRQQAEALYKESIDSTQRDLLTAFETITLPSIGAAVTATYRSRGLASPLTRGHFKKFLTEHFFGKAWETPSDTDLLEFSMRTAS